MSSRMCFVAAAVLLAVSPAASQPPTPDPTTTVAEVVVTARRSGIPIWRVGSGASAVVLVGSIGSAPKDLAWRADELEAAVAQSRKVYTSVAASLTAGDVYRLLFRRGRFTDLPKGQSLDSLVDAETAARLAAFAAARKLPADYRERRPWFVAVLLGQSLRRDSGIARRTGAESVVTRAAGKAKIPDASVLKLRVNDIVQDASKLRASDAACLDAVADAVDLGPAVVRERAVAWTQGRVAEVSASPLSRSEQSCWPDTDSELGPQLRQAWREVVRRELQTPGVVVAVAPLRYLAEEGGLLDTLAADGHAIDGPAWRAQDERVER